MLPPQTQSYIISRFPDGGQHATYRTFPHEVGAENAVFPPGWLWLPYQVRWSREDFDVQETAIVAVEPTAEGIIRSMDSPLTDILRARLQDPDPALAEVDELRGERLYDEWNLTILDSGQINDISAGDRVESLAFAIQHWFRAEAPTVLNNPPDQQWVLPVLPRVMAGSGDQSGMTDDRAMSRRAFTVRFRYTLTWRLLRDAVAEFGYLLNDDDQETTVTAE